jgi:hypothetical protein
MKARFIRFTIAVTVAVAIYPPCAHAFSDDTTRDLVAIGSPIRPAPVDPAIAHALQQISPQQIQHTIETLVDFHTRNTLSSMTKDLPSGQGASAAADWIESEFKRYSDACGGCLEVTRHLYRKSTKPYPTAHHHYQHLRNSARIRSHAVEAHGSGYRPL